MALEADPSVPPQPARSPATAAVARSGPEQVHVPSGNQIPRLPVGTASPIPPTAVAMTGNPARIASRMLRGNPSQLVASRLIWAACEKLIHIPPLSQEPHSS